MKVVIIGGSFGGLTAAFELRRLLGKEHEVALISDSDKFVFIPSLPWVSVGWTKGEDVVLGLREPLESKGIKFIHVEAQRIDAENKKVLTAKGEFSYDYLIISTGPYLEFEAIPGFGPSNTQSTCTLEHAIEAQKAWEEFLKNPGAIVIGAAQGASCFGPAYEQVYILDTYLRKKNLRHKAAIYFVTSEPYLGHFGIGGLGKSRRVTEDEFAERDIKAYTSAAIQEVTKDAIKLKDGTELKYKYAMIIPAFKGVKAVIDSGLGNPRGFVPVNEYYQHVKYPNIYAVGVAIAIAPPEATPVPTGVSKTGYMTERMALAAARNIAAEIKGSAKESKPLGVICVLDMGDTATLMTAEPVLPPRNKFFLKKNRLFHVGKLLFEKYYMWKIKLGAVWLP